MIVTVAVQVPILLLASLALSVTVLAPTLAQVNVFGVRLKLGGFEQASVLPLLIALAGTVTEPPGATVYVAFLHFAAGLVISLTVTVPVHVLDNPATFVTVNVTTFGPKLEQLKAVLLKL